MQPDTFTAFAGSFYGLFIIMIVFTAINDESDLARSSGTSVIERRPFQIRYIELHEFFDGLTCAPCGSLKCTGLTYGSTRLMESWFTARFSVALSDLLDIDHI
jgi:hypothetical protein